MDGAVVHKAFAHAETFTSSVIVIDYIHKVVVTYYNRPCSKGRSYAIMLGYYFSGHSPTPVTTGFSITEKRVFSVSNLAESWRFKGVWILR